MLGSSRLVGTKIATTLSERAAGASETCRKSIIVSSVAHTKSAGAGKYGRDSQPKYLGVKKHDGERVKTGDILIRQRGTKYLSGAGVRRGSDDTLFALRAGIVKFLNRRKISFDGSRRYVKMVSVVVS